MLAVTECPTIEQCGAASARLAILRDALLPHLQEATEVRTLASNALLFECGNLRTNIYRVEDGMLYLFEPASEPGAEPRAVGFALPGDMIGLGSLKIHAISAQATQQSVVSCLPLEAQDLLCDNDPALRERLFDAIEQEFDFLRRRALKAHAREAAPLGRLAALLTAISRNNLLEGRDPLLVSDALDSGTVADLLGIDVDTLTSLLLTLEARSLVLPTGGALAILDLEGLEALADG